MKNKILALITLLVLIVTFTKAQPGKIDETYGNLGTITLPINTGNTEKVKLLVLENNKTIIAGAFVADSVFLICYNENGSIDNTFGVNGLVITKIENESVINGLYLGKDNKILLVMANNQRGFYTPLLIKYNLNGQIEPNYGIKLINYFSPAIGAKSVLQRDGKILVASTLSRLATSNDIWLIRLNNDGTVDKTFGINGTQYVDLGDSNSNVLFDMVALDDGRFLVCGETIKWKDSFSKTYSYVSKLNNNGSIDTTFGNKGVLILNENQKGSNLFVLPSQDFLLTGSFFREGPNRLGNRFLTMKFNYSGQLDNSFGYEGYALDSFLDNSDNCEAIKIVRQSDGKFIAGGGISEFLGRSFLGMIRYDEGGQTDGTFGEDGKVVSAISSTGRDYFIDLALLNNGKIVVLSYDKNNNISITKYLNDTKLNVANKIKENTISIYPNPANSQLNITSGSNIKTILVYNVTGQLVKELICENNNLKNVSLAIDELALGMYMVQIIDEFDAKLTSKFIKE